MGNMRNDKVSEENEHEKYYGGTLTLMDGAELYMVPKEGMERLIAIYNKNLKKFIEISN